MDLRLGGTVDIKRRREGRTEEEREGKEQD